MAPSDEAPSWRMWRVGHMRRATAQRHGAKARTLFVRWNSLVLSFDI